MKNKKILKDIFIILGFVVIISGNVFIQEFSNLDEIWIYNFGRCILEGLLPYRDFNIIITPLFPYICALFLKLFGNEMIVLRFAEVIEITSILFFIYKILERLKINNGISLILTLCIYYIYEQIFCFDYNWAVLLVTLIIIFIELKSIENILELDFKRDLCLGILVRNDSTFKTNVRYCFNDDIYWI